MPRRNHLEHTWVDWQAPAGVDELTAKVVRSVIFTQPLPLTLTKAKGQCRHDIGHYTEQQGGRRHTYQWVVVRR